MAKSKEPVETEKDTLSETELKFAIQYYQEACNHARSYMDLRFKHFGTFIVIITILSGGVIKFPTEWEKSFCSLIALIITILFWTLDSRTAQYLAKYWNDVFKIEGYFRAKFASILQLTQNSDVPKRKKAFRSSMITNYLFALFTAIWVINLLYHLDKHFQWEIFHLPSSIPL